MACIELSGLLLKDEEDPLGTKTEAIRKQMSPHALKKDIKKVVLLTNAQNPIDKLRGIPNQTAIAFA